MLTLLLFDVTGNEALTYAVITAFIALVPILGTLAVAIVQQYYRVREALAVAQSNHVALHEQVLPQIAQVKAEGEAAHAETINLIRANGTNTGNTAGTVTDRDSNSV